MVVLYVNKNKISEVDLQGLFKEVFQHMVLTKKAWVLFLKKCKKRKKQAIVKNALGEAVLDKLTKHCY